MTKIESDLLAIIDSRNLYFLDHKEEKKGLNCLKFPRLFSATHIHNLSMCASLSACLFVCMSFASLSCVYITQEGKSFHRALTERSIYYKTSSDARTKNKPLGLVGMATEHPSVIPEESRGQTTPLSYA